MSDVPTIRLGTSDLQVGPISYGCWRFAHQDLVTAESLVSTALDAGWTLIDTADIYGFDGERGFGDAESLLGRVLARDPSLRDRMVLATKGGIVPGVPYVSGAGALTAACEASLRRLRVDHVDLYQVHRPDLFTHPAEVAGALVALHERGLVRYVGVSNHTPAQVAALQAHLSIPLASVQPELSVAALGALRDGTLDQAMQYGMAVLAWSPLAGGRVATGEGLRPQLVEVLDRFAEQHSTTRTAIALAFVLAHPSRPVAIVGTQQLPRIADAVAAAAVQLTRREVYEIIEASEGVPLP